jgi:type I restriction-modification system DNA methylase subunit
MSDLGTHLFASQLLPYFEACGYSSSEILRDVSLKDAKTATFAGFAQRPFDNRSACFTVMDVVTSPIADAGSCRNVGAPLTFLCHQDRLLWWSQTDREPYQVGEAIRKSQLEGFFREHAHDFAPSTIYRAKTLGRFNKEYQQTFVDLELMPLLEREAGEMIERLLLDSVAEARDSLGWPKDLDLKQGQWLVKSVFWLLGAKMLHDKGVEGFIRLNFGNVDEVFSRLAKHYGESADTLIASNQMRRALEPISQRIASSIDLRLTTTEALAYVYENTLISDEIRAELGTHSTPSYLVDYVVGRLEPWIRNLDQDQRAVFEPACGHAAFLVAAIRLLTSLLSPSMAQPASRKQYLRDRVYGYDTDDFAVEIARLSLTLTDIPNPNGWSVRPADLFASDLIERIAKRSTILLANVPFEDFKEADRSFYSRTFRKPRFVSKAAEILNRALSAMPSGGLFGVIVPQTLLHRKNVTEFRELLIRDFEFQEICLFPDKVFNFAAHESAVLIGRKNAAVSTSFPSVRYRRVRPREMELFKRDFEVTSEVNVDQHRFERAEDFDLRIPDLEQVWQHCINYPKLTDYVDVGQGFSHLGKDQPGFPSGTLTVSDKEFEGAVEGYENLGPPGLKTHELPPLKWLNLSDAVVRRAISGTKCGIPQILVNQPPIQIAPWCLRAMIDRVGRPAKSSFTILRPRADAISLEFLWAVLNSPFANAYAYSHSSKRNILTGSWRKFPLPKFTTEAVSHVESLVRNYFEALNEREGPFQLRSENALVEEAATLRDLHWRIDAEILRLYDLPTEYERQLLDYFTGWERVGVPFKQDRYFPEGFDEPLSLADFLGITIDWQSTNTKRHKLIQEKAAQNLLAEQADELRRLQHLAGLKRELLSSPSLKELYDVEAELRKRGLWKGA